MVPILNRIAGEFKGRIPLYTRFTAPKTESIKFGNKRFCLPTFRYIKNEGKKLSSLTINPSYTMDSNGISIVEIIEINIVCSFIASFLFIFFILIFLRPRIKISTVIAKNIDSFEHNKECYTFKFVNKSWFSAYAVEIEINEVISIPVDGGQNARYTKLPIKTQNISHLSPFRPKWLKSNYGLYALQIRAYEDMDKIINIPLKSIQMEVTLKHGLTGLTKVFRQTYSVGAKIKSGQFVFGNSFDVL
jgi:hypothetical protein